MGLIKCPDCGKLVSDRSAFCVNCGCPMEYIKENENVYCYCSVEYIDNIYSKNYYYISDDKSVKEGDFAMVENNDGSGDKIVKITNVKLCTEENVPYPIQNTKHLKRKIYGKEIEKVMLKYMETYTNMVVKRKQDEASIYLNKFFPLVENYAKQGFSFGQLACGVLYETVLGNNKIAEQWYEKAAKQGDVIAEKKLKKLRQNTSSNESFYCDDERGDEFSYSDWMDYTGGEPLDSYDDHEE